MRFNVVSSAVFVLLSVLSRNAWAKPDSDGSTSSTDYCALINSGQFSSDVTISSQGRSIVSNYTSTQRIRTLHEQGLPSPIIDRITTTELEKNCIPLMRFSKKDSTRERLEWSLADCFAIKSLPESDLKLCREIDLKLSSLLKRNFETVANEYGYTHLYPGAILAAIIIDRCKREPVTENLFRNSAVVNFLKRQAELVTTGSAGNRTTKPAQ